MSFKFRPPAFVVELYWRISASLWFVPALAVLGGLALAILVFSVAPLIPASAMRAFPKVEAGAVKDVLQLLASSTLTVATVTFSVLMVVMTMTASTFSPRALTGYMRDRVNQATLAIFLGSFAFGVTAALLTRVNEPDQRLLGLLVIVAVGAALLVLGTLVYFIHHTATTVQITSLVMRLHRGAGRTLDSFLGQLPAERPDTSLPAAYAVAPPAAVEARQAGFVQVLTLADLRDLAIEHDVVIRVIRQVGDFAVRRMPLCEIWPAGRLTPELADAVRSAYAIGQQRTAEADPMLGVELLGEVAERALSPGINDPYTAVSCIRYLSDLLVEIAPHPLPGRTLCDDEDMVRVIVPTPDFRDFVERPLLGIASAGAGHVPVALALLTLIGDLLQVTEDEGRRVQLVKLARQMADNALEKLELERGREQVRAALQALPSADAATAIRRVEGEARA